VGLRQPSAHSQDVLWDIYSPWNKSEVLTRACPSLNKSNQHQVITNNKQHIQHRPLSAQRLTPMATPGNFGGGSTGPDQIFLGITRAPPSAPGRGRAQSPVRRNPNPQTTEHEAAEGGSRSQVSYSSKAQEVCVSLGSSVPTQLQSSAFDSWA
jgi:hypothetical protein